MYRTIGTCSICGGDVIEFIGPWHSITEPPEPNCSRCGAVKRKNIIQMEAPKLTNFNMTFTTTTKE